MISSDGPGHAVAADVRRCLAMRLPNIPSRRHASLLAAALVTIPRLPSIAFEVVVPSRTDEEITQLKLYGGPGAAPPSVDSYQQQVNDAITIQSMRGVWSLQEKMNGRATTGKLIFRGAETEERGSVTYMGEAANGRGPWIIKADGFGRAPAGKVGGAIERKALWKLRRGQGGTFTYAGRVNVLAYGADGLPDAFIEGDVIELVNGGKPKGGSERKAGTFRAVLERRLTAAEEAAATDGAAAGGAPEALQVTTKLDDRLVYQNR